MTTGTSKDSGSQRPQAFRLEDADIKPVAPLGDISAVGADGSSAQSPVLAPRLRPRRRWPWARWLIGLAASLVLFAVGVAVTDWVIALFSRQDWLGWIALGLAGLTALAALGLAAREVFGLIRMSRVSRLHEDASNPMPSEASAAAVANALSGLYADRPELAEARANLRAHRDDVLSPQERIALAERLMLPALDAEAKRLIGEAVARVSVVTAVSPAALIDIGVVLIVHLGLIRRLAELYGGRPGGLALVRLSRRVIAHLALTGGIALGDDMIHQVLGHGLAARISARLGEGVLNGLLTARIGRAALEVCRPVPFNALPAPKISQLAAAVIDKKAETAAEEETGT